MQSWADHKIICGKNGFFNSDRIAITQRKAKVRHMMWWYQPIDEVRDYFGDHVGLVCDTENPAPRFKRHLRKPHSLLLQAETTVL